MWSYSLFYYTKCGLTNGHCLFQECSVSYWTELILLLNAQAISKYRKIQKTVASLVKIVKYWAFLSESGNTMWCLYVWYTQSYVCGKSCKTISFYFQMIRYLSSLEIWLWPFQCCVFWVISSVPTPLSLPEATIPGVCSFSLNVWLFCHLGSTLLLMTPQQNLGVVYNSSPLAMCLII